MCRVSSFPGCSVSDEGQSLSQIHRPGFGHGPSSRRGCVQVVLPERVGGHDEERQTGDSDLLRCRARGSAVGGECAVFRGIRETQVEGGRSEKRLQEWRDALQKLAELTGFRLADYKSDEAKLKREVVNEVERLLPSNDPVEVEQYRVGLEDPTESCIQVLEKMGDGIGLLGLVGTGGVGKTTLAREIYNHYVGEKKFRWMTFLEIHQDPSFSDVQVRPTWSGNLREQLLWDLQDTTSNALNEAFAYWEGCKNSTSFDSISTPHTSLQNLINKNLVVQGFKVHDLLRALGQEIAMKAKRHYVHDGF